MKISMHSLLTVLVLASVCSLPCGCVSPARYHAFSPTTGVGYYEDNVGENEYVVEFRGNIKTTSAMTKNFVLYRCAELTHEKGFDHFVLLGLEDAPYALAHFKANQFFSGYVAYIRICNGEPEGNVGNVYNAQELMRTIDLQNAR